MALPMKLKNIGKTIMRKVNLNLKRKEILEISKKYIVKDGWNEGLFESISKKSKFKINEIKILFSEGYLSLLKFYLNELDTQMTSNAKKINLIRMKTHERIKQIILLRLKNNQNEKNVIRKTYFTLLLPHHSKVALRSLYKTVDQIWFIAGDKSVDFNFYSKRFILAAIYSSVILYWIKNQDIKKTTNFLDKQLIKVSKITQTKNNFKNIFIFFPQIFNIFKSFRPTKQ